jgi:hypothetical protein
LAHAHEDAGVVDEARAAFAHAHRLAAAEPSLQPRVGVDIARFELGLGAAIDVDTAAAALLAGLTAASTTQADADTIDVVARLAQAAEAAGRIDVACALLQAGRRRSPADPRLVALQGCPP